MPKKLRLLLLDASIVIKLHTIGLWAEVVTNCEVYVGEIVVDESQETEDGRPIDLQPDLDAQRIHCISATPTQMKTFSAKFQPDYVEKLDAGELELLAHLYTSDEEFLICSSDGIVYRVLGALQRSHQGLSLEEVLGKIGKSCRVEHQYTKTKRESLGEQGFQDRMNGFGVKE